MFLLIALAGCVSTYLSVAVLYMLAQIADNSDAIAENSKKQLLALSRLETLLRKTEAPKSIVRVCAGNPLTRGSIEE